MEKNGKVVLFYYTQHKKFGPQIDKLGNSFQGKQNMYSNVNITDGDI
jgi:hypothetical protein